MRKRETCGRCLAQNLRNLIVSGGEAAASADGTERRPIFATHKDAGASSEGWYPGG